MEIPKAGFYDVAVKLGSASVSDTSDNSNRDSNRNTYRSTDSSPDKEGFRIRTFACCSNAFSGLPAKTMEKIEKSVEL